MKRLLFITAAAISTLAPAVAQDTTIPTKSEMEGDFIILNSQTYEGTTGISDMRAITITADGDSLNISNLFMRGCLDVKAGYNETNGNLTIESGVMIYHVENIVYYLYQWNDNTEEVNLRPITFTYKGNDEWSTDATLMILAGYEESEDFQTGYFAQGSQIIKANATTENVSYAASGLDRYDESRPSLVRIDDTVISIYNFLQADQYGYGCMIQGVIDNSGSRAVFLTSVVGQANDLTYRVLASCVLNEDGNFPTGIGSAMNHEGYTYADINLEEGIIDFEPMAIWAASYDDTSGALTINTNSVYETVAESTVTFDPDKAYTSSIKETTVGNDSNAEVERVDYYRIDGTMTRQPHDGELVIKRTLFKDKTMKTEKVIWQN